MCACRRALAGAQRVFAEKGYASWVGLSGEALKEKAAPYRRALAEGWKRLKRACPEMQSAAKPFQKPKWDDRTYFLVQDGIYDRMDSGAVSINEGLSDLAVFALIRLTCSRPGALGKDQFDVSGAMAKWARHGGEHVMRCAVLRAREHVRERARE